MPFQFCFGDKRGFVIRVRFGERLPSSALQDLAMERWARQGIIFLQVCTRDQKTVKI